jgi:hypothetical protein
MFVRFRQTRSSLQATLLLGRRVGGRVRQEQIAALGSVKMPLTVDGREAFWRKLHELLARLGNRIPPEAQAKIMGEVHSRIPMVTADDRREHEIALADRERQVWNGLQGILAERAEGMDGVAASATASAAADREGASDAGARAAAAAGRVDRLRRGDDDVSRGQEVDLETILREAGWTTAKLNHCHVLAALPREALPILRDISIEAGERAVRAAARRMLRKQK